MEKRKPLENIGNLVEKAKLKKEVKPSLNFSKITANYLTIMTLADTF